MLYFLKPPSQGLPGSKILERLLIQATNYRIKRVTVVFDVSTSSTMYSFLESAGTFCHDVK